MKTEEAYVHWIKRFKLFHNKLIWLRIKYGEFHIGKLIRAAGGKWNPNTKLWELPYKEALALGLENRIAKEKS